MHTSQSAQSHCDNAPKNVSLADGGSSENTLGFLSETFKRKMYDQTDQSLYYKQSMHRFLKMYKHWNFGQE